MEYRWPECCISAYLSCRPDWYGFAQVGPVLLAPVFLLLIAVTYGIARGVWKLGGGVQ